MDNLFSDIQNTPQKEKWEDMWTGMPEFVQNNLEPWKQIIINFENEHDMLEFAKLVNQKITPRTQSIWYPAITPEKVIDKKWVAGNKNL